MEMIPLFDKIWPLIPSARGEFFSLLTLTFALGAGGAFLILRERLAHWQDLVAEYKSKLGNETPVEVAKRIDRLTSEVREIRPLQLDIRKLDTLQSLIDSVEGVVEIQFESQNPYTHQVVGQLRSVFRFSSATIVLTEKHDLESGIGLLVLVGAMSNPQVERIFLAFAQADIPLERRNVRDSGANPIIQVVEPLASRVAKLSPPG